MTTRVSEKPPNKNVKKKHWMIFERWSLGLIHDQVFIAVFRFCAIVGVAETGLVNPLVAHLWFSTWMPVVTLTFFQQAVNQESVYWPVRLQQLPSPDQYLPATWRSIKAWHGAALDCTRLMLIHLPSPSLCAAFQTSCFFFLFAIRSTIPSLSDTTKLLFIERCGLSFFSTSDEL